MNLPETLEDLLALTFVKQAINTNNEDRIDLLATIEKKFQKKGRVAFEVALRKYKRSRVEETCPKEEIPLEHDVTVLLHATLPLTDAWNGLRMVERHGDNLRYCTPWKQWLIWNDSRWEKDETQQIMHYAQETIRSIGKESFELEDKEKQKKWIAWAAKSLSRERLQAMITLAQHHLSILPDQLDTDPYLLHTPGGTVDLRTGQLRAPKREDYITQMTSITPDFSGKCPTWNRVVSWATGEEQPDGSWKEDFALINLLNRAFGYMLTGSTEEHVLFLPHGSGSNGKSTLFNCVQNILGDYATTLDREVLYVHKNQGMGATPELAKLFRKRLAVASEGSQEKRLDIAVVKSMVSADKQTARNLYSSPFDFTPTHKILFYTNHLPRIDETDQGTWRRMLLLPFDRQVTEEEKDTKLPNKLEKEAPAILAKLIQACLLWQKDGLGTCARSKVHTDAYQNSMDQLAEFFELHCVFEEKAQVTKQDLHTRYIQWCEATHLYAQNQVRFVRTVKERYPKLGEDKGTGGVRRWRGLGLRNPDNHQF